ncbi:MAG: hypothetical protein GXY83_28610 [Rhodopirellula sp.]|nr:hypothetical protein [Rhodopirellula sp.]
MSGIGVPFPKKNAADYIVAAGHMLLSVVIAVTPWLGTANGSRPRLRAAQTLVRYSDIRSTRNVYTHIELHVQTAAIESLRAPPAAKKEDGAEGRRRLTG